MCTDMEQCASEVVCTSCRFRAGKSEELNEEHGREEGCVMSAFRVLHHSLLFTLVLIPSISLSANLFYKVCHTSCSVNMYEQLNIQL